MRVFVNMISEIGKADSFVYEAHLTEQNEDTGDYVWSGLDDGEIVTEMIDRAMEQARCLYPNHKVMSIHFEW